MPLWHLEKIIVACFNPTLNLQIFVFELMGAISILVTSTFVLEYIIATMGAYQQWMLMGVH
jgi:hypothetical protein